ncbi:hypothetical protein BDV93DRAFT_526547 [Ceratobasidium sp. AG-I]|nr:hypothetical protein BDV93DRAFT_526547 [Ceratobasidium sp. AG-I]
MSGVIRTLSVTDVFVAVTTTSALALALALALAFPIIQHPVHSTLTLVPRPTSVAPNHRADRVRRINRTSPAAKFDYAPASSHANTRYFDTSTVIAGAASVSHPPYTRSGSLFLVSPHPL